MLPQPQIKIQEMLHQTLCQILETGKITRNHQTQLWQSMSAHADLSFEERKGIKRIIDGLQRGKFEVID